MDKLILKIVFVLNGTLCLVITVHASDISSAYGQTIKLASGYEQLIKESPSTGSKKPPASNPHLTKVE